MKLVMVIALTARFKRRGFRCRDARAWRQRAGAGEKAAGAEAVQSVPSPVGCSSAGSKHGGQSQVLETESVC